MCIYGNHRECVCIFICLGTNLLFPIQLKDYTKNQEEVDAAKG